MMRMMRIMPCPPARLSADRQAGLRIANYINDANNANNANLHANNANLRIANRIYSQLALLA